MIAIPSIMMITALAMLSLFASTILSRPWMRNIALGCAVLEGAMAIELIVVTTGKM